MSGSNGNDGRSDPQARNGRGLLDAQETWLKAFIEVGYSEACNQTDITRQRVRRWLREDKRFQDIYAEEVEGSISSTRTRLEEMAGAAADELMDLLKATQPKKCTFICRSCDTKNEHTITVNNDAVRAKVAEMILKASTVLKDHRVVEGKIELQLTLDERLAMARLKSGRTISLQKQRRFEELGLVDGEGNIVVEGEFKKLEEGEN